MRTIRAALTATLLLPGVATAQDHLLAPEVEAAVHATLSTLASEIAEIDRKREIIAATVRAAIATPQADNPSLEIYKLILNTMPALPELASADNSVDTAEDLIAFLRPISDELLSAKIELTDMSIRANEQHAAIHEAHLKAMIPGR